MEAKRIDGVVLAFVSMEGELDESVLSDAERALARSAKTPVRRRELLAGRLAARMVWKEAGVSIPPSILRDEDGRPRLEPPLPGWFVSIAHDGGWALAAVARGRLGVDLFDLRRLPSVQGVVERRLATGRAHSLDQRVELPWPDAALLWTGWEALGKSDGRGVLSAMRLQLSLDDVSTDGVATGHVAQGTLRWWAERGVLCCLATEASGE